jgi:hypothetical protein
MERVTKEKLEKYIKLTDKAIKVIEKNKIDKKGKELLKLAKCYFEDAKYFKNRGEYINAFSAINYAHAFLDCGVILKIFKVKDNRLFMAE